MMGVEIVMKRHTFIPLGLAALLAPLLSACGGGGGEEGDAAEDGPDAIFDDTPLDDGLDGDADDGDGPPPTWDPGDITAKLRPDHPRIFLNGDTLDGIVAFARGPMSAHYDRVVEAAADYPAAPDTADHGEAAMNTAFLYLATGEAAYLDKARALLRASVTFYEERLAANEAVDWYSTSRVSALAAWDWLYNDLDPAERDELLGRLLHVVRDVQPEVNEVPGENSSDHRTGFYGVQNMLWYAGLAGYGEGVDDELARTFLLDGLEMHVQLYAYRKECAGDDGGPASATMGYSFGAYPWAEFNFMHSWASATGEDLAPTWTHLAAFPGYVFWNWLPGETQFGYGDDGHTENALGFWSGRLHFAEITHFFRDVEPDMAAFSQWMGERSPEGGFSVSTWGIHPLLLTRLADAPAPAEPPPMPLARHYENQGQILMRSGSGLEDTYAMFAAGGFITQHRHYDAGSFLIYRGGFLALDTGTRVNEDDPATMLHMTEYYARTIAHNAVLIFQPGEEFGQYWGWPMTGNDGGQDDLGSTSVVLAFETGEAYAYAAADTTACYDESKAAEVVRQLVFLPPSHFVVFDRVTSTQPEYAKYWLLHFAGEPAQVDEGVWSADQGTGRLFCQTLLPEDAGFSVVGGAGSEFMVFGTTYPFSGYETEMTDLMGRSRLEVSPGAPRTADVFLHLLETGDPGMADMSRGTLLDEGGMTGVGFTSGGKSYEVLFNVSGVVGGTIRVEEGGEVTLDQPLAESVQPQSGPSG
jgi:hypothetical protein